MSSVAVLIKRNVKLFLRDKTTVFFSFLSMIILVALYFLFIAKIYTVEMDIPASGGVGLLLSEAAKNFIVYFQMMAGVLVLNSMSLATGAFSTIAKDFESGHVDSLLLTPIKTREMILSYFCAGFISSFLINILTFILSHTIIGLTTGYWLSIETFLVVILILFVTSLISCAIMLLIVSLIKSSTALGVINGISGTLLGFLCGIYMPYSILGSGTKVIGSLIPFSHIVIWLKQVVLNNAFLQVGVVTEFKEILLDSFSASNIGFASLSVPLWATILFAGIFGVLCLCASYYCLNKRIKR